MERTLEKWGSRASRKYWCVSTLKWKGSAPSVSPRGEKARGPSQMRQVVFAPGRLPSSSFSHLWRPCFVGSVICCFIDSWRQRIIEPPRSPRGGCVAVVCASRPPLRLPLRVPGSLLHLRSLGGRALRW
ncbi:hypothetical protein TcCL_NonESM11974 [Trypanosoma cruzi]|nr:hypothetical protein TcCL_NonESM11974 [Trypanosoma cruzi]